MNYKVQGALKKSRKYYIIYTILWLFLVIVFIMPAGAAIKDATVNDVFDFGNFLKQLGNYVTNPFSSFSLVFTANYFSSFLGILWKFTFVYFIIAVIGIIRNAPKNEYADIEHGSSDWSQKGEQYRILSNKKGIILAEGNYLPVDKRGNVNVLVVGRFWFW